MMRRLVQPGWIAIQLAIIGGPLYWWSQNSSPDKPALGTIFGLSVFLAFAATALVIALTDSAKQLRHDLPRWRDRYFKRGGALVAPDAEARQPGRQKRDAIDVPFRGELPKQRPGGRIGH